MITASCHCGAVQLHAPRVPEYLVACTCSICRRLGARWAFYTREEVTVEAGPDAVRAYVWGDGLIEFCHCATCGVPTHYDSVEKVPTARLAINARGFEPAQVDGVRIRVFDGADSWQFLDQDETW